MSNFLPSIHDRIQASGPGLKAGAQGYGKVGEVQNRRLWGGRGAFLATLAPVRAN